MLSDRVRRTREESGASDYSLNVHFSRMTPDRGLTRRRFVQSVGGNAAALLGLAWMLLAPADPAEAVLRSHPRKRSENAKAGMQVLGLGSDRDGFMYIPANYSAEKPTLLLVLLHGATQDSTLWSRATLAGLFDNPPMIIIAPDSRERTWDLSLGGYGPGVRFIDDEGGNDSASVVGSGVNHELVAERCPVDGQRVDASRRKG